MTIQEYITVAKKELDDFEAKWIKGEAEDPNNWPHDMDEGDWADQELAERFGSTW